MKKFKYKREHVDTQEQYDAFKRSNTKSRKAWLEKHELLNPEHRERRIIRQRLYSRYYNHTDFKISFRDWLKEEYDIDDINAIGIELLRAKVSKS